MFDCESGQHDWYVFDSDTDRIFWTCALKCGAEKQTATAARHLNNAIAAIYANVGPSCPLVDIRTAMKLLGIEETNPPQPWEHWFASSEREWANP
jgi:hypothetical protein